MRLLAACLACTMALSWASSVDAGERRKGERKPTVSEREDRSSYRRSSTVDRQGLCQRDTGRPMNSLRLDHQCDREEFWARFNDVGNDRH